MNFRCFTCSLVMSEGLPPLEALSLIQIVEVGTDVPDSDRRFDALIGTRFEGLSVYNFCAFCFTVITEYPSYRECGCDIEYTREKDWMAEVQYEGIECATHGELFRAQIDMRANESFTMFDGVLRTRHSMFHKVQQMYHNADLTQLFDLLQMEV